MELRQLLPHLHYFWAVAKYKSFTKAATGMHVTTSAISYQIRALEDKLNILLLKRDCGQRTELTKTGEKVFRHCQQIFGQMDLLFDEIITQEVNNELMIAAPISFGTHVLMPATRYINEKLPHAILKVDLSDHVLDIHEENIDICIRNIPPKAQLEGEQLMKVKHQAIASNEYLSRSSPLNNISDIANHNIICTHKGEKDWLRVEECFPNFIKPPEQHITYIDSNISVIEGVKNGIGIGLLPDYTLDGAYMDSKGIKLVLTDYFTDSGIDLMDTLFICHPRHTLKNKLIGDFIHYLKEYLRREGMIICGESPVI